MNTVQPVTLLHYNKNLLHLDETNFLLSNTRQDSDSAIKAISRSVYKKRTHYGMQYKVLILKKKKQDFIS